MFTKSLLVRSVLALALVPALAISAPAVGKVRSALGSVDRLKARQNDWAALRVGASLFQSDRIRTGTESEVIFGLPDGSSISIAENAEVELSSLLEPNGEGGFETLIDIKKGHLNFAVRKLQQKKSKFVFKTGTMTASIRGTEGYIGGDENFFAGLKTGKLDITTADGRQTVSVLAGETALGKDSLVVVKLASSGDAKFAKRLERMLAKSDKPLAEMVKEAQQADSTYQEEVKAEALEKLNSLPNDGFSLTTSSPVEVCDQGLMIEGNYRTSDANATLVVMLGDGYQSSNLLRSADGKPHSFAHKVALNDDNGLWNAEKAKVVFNGAGISDIKTIDIHVNRSCSEVNTKSPALMISSYDSLRCVANISINDMQHDAGILTVTVDGANPTEDAITKNTQKRLKLNNGSHEYNFRVEDQAGNKSEETKVMGCYPAKRFSIDVGGPAKEILKVPPPPYGMEDRITQNLQFKIKIPENNPDLLYKVVVKQNGKVILQETLSQIQGLDYLIPVDIVRTSPNRFDIEVTHKSGFKAKAKKSYEVGF